MNRDVRRWNGQDIREAQDHAHGPVEAETANFHGHCSRH